MREIKRLPGPLRGVLLLSGIALVASTAAAAVLPIEGQGYVERPVGGSGFYGQPGVVSGGFFEGHAGRDGQLWILDRQTGRVRSCTPPGGEDQAPRCSPWSQ
jgi:hypothetical protein